MSIWQSNFLPRELHYVGYAFCWVNEFKLNLGTNRSTHHVDALYQRLAVGGGITNPLDDQSSNQSSSCGWCIGAHIHDLQRMIHNRNCNADARDGRWTAVVSKYKRCEDGKNSDDR